MLVEHYLIKLPLELIFINHLLVFYVIIEHVYVHEAGGLSTLSQAMAQPINPKNGIHLTLEDDILPNFIIDDGEIHGAPTKLICLENTLHGMIFPIEEIKNFEILSTK